MMLVGAQYISGNLLVTPHVPRYCERHDGPPVYRIEDATCCEHHDTDEDGVPGYCCYCGSEGEWRVVQDENQK
jgi:hypothetical protein